MRVRNTQDDEVNFNCIISHCTALFLFFFSRFFFHWIFFFFASQSHFHPVFDFIALIMRFDNIPDSFTAASNSIARVAWHLTLLSISTDRSVILHRKNVLVFESEIKFFEIHLSDFDRNKVEKSHKLHFTQQSTNQVKTLMEKFSIFHSSLLRCSTSLFPTSLGDRSTRLRNLTNETLFSDRKNHPLFAIIHLKALLANLQPLDRLSARSIL